MNATVLDPVQDLLNHILKIRGDKIVTLATNTVFSFNIDREGHFSPDPLQEHFFREKLIQAFQQGGGMIIREFLPLKMKRQLQPGKTGWVPEQNLYGVFIGDSTWIGLDAATVQKMQEDKNDPHLKEDWVHYQPFPSIE